jgi:hypothetical protein
MTIKVIIPLPDNDFDTTECICLDTMADLSDASRKSSMQKGIVPREMINMPE